MCGKKLLVLLISLSIMLSVSFSEVLYSQEQSPTLSRQELIVQLQSYKQQLSLLEIPLKNCLATINNLSQIKKDLEDQLIALQKSQDADKQLLTQLQSQVDSLEQDLKVQQEIYQKLLKEYADLKIQFQNISLKLQALELQNKISTGIIVTVSAIAVGELIYIIIRK